MIPHLALILLLTAAPPVDPLGETMFAEARYADAARTFESSWSVTPRPAALAWAGLSRLRAGHAAHAAAYLARALTGPLPDDLRRTAQAQLVEAHARTHTTAIRLDLHDPPGPLTLVVRRTGVEVPALHLDVIVPPGVTRHVMLVPLDPGEWTLELHRASALRASRVVDIRADQPPFLLADRLPPPKPAAPAPVDHVRYPRLALAGGVAGGLTTIVGASIIVVTQRRAVALHDTLASYHARCTPTPCEEAFAQALNWRTIGAGLLGAGVGVLAATLPGLVRDPKRRRVIWATEAALGAVSLISGATAAGIRGAALNSTYPGELSLSSTIGHSVGTAFIGLGVTLAATATASLIADSVLTRRRTRPPAALDGLTLRF